MRTYLVLLALSTALSYALTLWLARAAEARGWARRTGDGPGGGGVPRLGGVAVFATPLFAIGLLLLWNNEVAARMAQNFARGAALLLAAGAVFALGLFDDLRGARPWQKLLVQCAAGIGLFTAGFRVELLTNPFTSTSMELGWFSLPATLLWLVAISNAFNLIDGLDGLAAGVGVFSALALFLLAMMVGDSFVASLAVALAGALAGFLPHNFSPARIYLGDSGSLTVGLVLAALAVAGAQKGSVLITVAIPLMIFGLPLLDASVTTVRRLLSGHPVFTRDEEHLHHRLVQLGLTPRSAMLVLHGVAGLFALSAMVLLGFRGTVAPIIALVCGLGAWLLVSRMQYPEFAELDSTVRLALRSQHRVLRNQILLRRMTSGVRTAASPEEVWRRVAEVLSAFEFDYADAEWGHKGTPARRFRWTAAPRLESISSSEAEKSWEMTVPLATGPGFRGHIRLGRDLSRGVILFRLSSLLDFLGQAAAARLCELSAEEIQAEPALVDAMPRRESA